uniref:Uncharacterized protein n=1 Tax=viral metagenome TaxID=1070528 RepID=A0A6C0CNP0_9ZZZZ
MTNKGTNKNRNFHNKKNITRRRRKGRLGKKIIGGDTNCNYKSESPFITEVPNVERNNLDNFIKTTMGPNSAKTMEPYPFQYFNAFAKTVAILMEEAVSEICKTAINTPDFEKDFRNVILNTYTHAMDGINWGKDKYYQEIKESILYSHTLDLDDLGESDKKSLIEPYDKQKSVMTIFLNQMKSDDIIVNTLLDCFNEESLNKAITDICSSKEQNIMSKMAEIVESIENITIKELTSKVSVDFNKEKMKETLKNVHVVLEDESSLNP